MRRKVIIYLPIWWVLTFLWLLKEDWDVVHVADLDTYIPAIFVAKTKRKSDLLFVLYDPNVPNNRYASLNKLFEAMMCGKPILVGDETAMTEIVREEDCGRVVPYGDVDAIKHAIRTLKNDSPLCKRLGENGRKAYGTKYSGKIMEGRLLEVYDKLDPEQRRAGAIVRSSPNTAGHRL